MEILTSLCLNTNEFKWNDSSFLLDEFKEFLGLNRILFTCSILCKYLGYITRNIFSVKPDHHSYYLALFSTSKMQEANEDMTKSLMSKAYIQIEY